MSSNDEKYLPEDNPTIDKMQEDIQAYMESSKDYMQKIEEMKDLLYPKVFLFDPTKSEKILSIFFRMNDSFPSLVKSAIKSTLAKFWKGKIPLDKMIENITVRITDSKRVKFADLGPGIENIPVAFDAIVLAWENTQTYSKSATFFCLDCSATSQSKADPVLGKMLTPVCKDEDCPSYKKPMSIHPGTLKTGFVRKIVIQEPIEESKMGNPLDYDCEIKDDDVANVYLGQRIHIVGNFRSFPKKIPTPTGNRNDIIIQAMSVTPAIQVTRMMPDQSQLEFFKEYVGKENFEDSIVESYCPPIYGEKLSKYCILLYLLSGNVVEVEGTKLRGIINLFFIGDPGTAKTKLMQWASNVSQSFAYVNGRMASGAGITISLDRIRGRQMPRIGPALLFEKLAIDEMGRMQEEDMSALHELMENGEVTLAKGGYYLKQKKETAILGAANPKGDYYDIESRLVDNANISETILSRNDIIVNMMDIHNQVEDQMRTDHILKVRKKQYKKKPEHISTEQMLLFLNYASQLEPELTDEAEKSIRKFYLDLRGFEYKKGDKRTDRRMLESIIRVSTAIAKLHLSDTVKTTHVERCIKLYKDAYATFGKSLEKDSQQLAMSPTVDNKEQAIVHTFRKLEGQEQTEYLPADQIIKTMFDDFPNLFREIEDASRYFDLCEKQNKMQERNRLYRWLS